RPLTLTCKREKVVGKHKGSCRGSVTGKVDDRPGYRRPSHCADFNSHRRTVITSPQWVQENSMEDRNTPRGTKT
ncbi:MAG: hypothetical protein AABZ47_16865, partial [Planctomycetota bacterium]